MTLLDVKSAIISELCHRDVATIADFAHVSLPEQLADRREQVLRAVLAGLEAEGLVKSLGGDQNSAATEVWVATAPISAIPQALTVSLATASAIADEVNAYIDALQTDWPRVDPLQLHEGTLLMLLSILADLRGEAGDADISDLPDLGEQP